MADPYAAFADPVEQDPYADFADEAPQQDPGERGLLGRAVDYVKDYGRGVAEAAGRTQSSDVVDSFTDAAKGLASIGSNIAAPFAAYPRFIFNKLGLTDAPEETYAESRDRFVFTPEDQGARGVAETFGAVLKPVGDVVSLPGKGLGALARNLGASEQDAADLEGMAIDATGIALGARALGKRAAAKIPDPNPGRIARTPEQVARAAGLKILPSQADSAPIGTVAETLAGSARLAKLLNKANAPQVLNLIREELGLAKGAKLTAEQFAKLREPLNAAYAAVSEQLGTLKADPALKTALRKVGGQKGLTPNRQVVRLREQYAALDDLPAAQVVQEIRSLREKASSNIKTPHGVKDRVQLKELGKAQQEIANALDDMLERGAKASGKPEVIQQYKDARVALAKIGTAERAVNAPGGPAQSLAKQQIKGAPLTGRFKIIAESARAFPEVLGKPPVQSGLESIVDLATGGLRRAIVSPAVRAALESNLYQNSLGRAAPVLGSGSSVGAYFDDGSSGLPPVRPRGPIPPVGRGSDAGRLAGDLDLAEGPLPGAPAYAGPPLSASGLAGALELLPPRLLDELALIDEGVPSRPLPRGPSFADELAGELSLAPEQGLSLADNPPLAPQYVGPPLSAADLAGTLELLPEQLSPGRAAGNFRQGPPPAAGAADLIDVPPSTPPVSGGAAASRAQDLLAGDPALAAELEQLAAGVVPARTRSPLRNNASREGDTASAASAEAQARLKAEQAAGQTRYLIEKDGSYTPLIGVDAVDAVARPGQVIVQRGIGAEPYTVLDSNGVPRAQLKGILARFQADLDTPKGE